MAEIFDGVAWAILGGHIISAQGHKQLHTYHKWREKQMRNRKSISPCNPNTLYESGVEDLFELTRLAHSIWMIAWVWKSLIGNNVPHVHHHSYLKEAIGQQGGFHLHLPPFYDVSHMILHAWEETLEERFVADHFEQWWRLLMRRPQEEEGRIFSPLI